jgi:hypothetical protein
MTINKAVDLDRIPARMLRTLQKKLFLQSITYLVNNKSIMDGMFRFCRRLQRLLKEYRMFSVHAGLRDPCTRDVARLSESVKILDAQASVFLRFPKVEQHLKCMDHAILLGKLFGDCFIK